MQLFCVSIHLFVRHELHMFVNKEAEEEEKKEDDNVIEYNTVSFYLVGPSSNPNPSWRFKWLYFSLI